MVSGVPRTVVPISHTGVAMAPRGRNVTASNARQFARSVHSFRRPRRCNRRLRVEAVAWLRAANLQCSEHGAVRPIEPCHVERSETSLNIGFGEQVKRNDLRFFAPLRMTRGMRLNAENGGYR